MNSIWSSLFSNLALVSIMIVVWTVVSDLLSSQERRWQDASLGVLCGATSIIAMIIAREVSPGFIFDLRHAMLAAAGFFGGPIAAAIACTLTGSYRLYVGGGGQFVGVLSILISSGIGVAGYFLGRHHYRSLPEILALGCAVVAGILMSFLLIEASIRASLFQQTAIPLSSVTFIGVVLTCFLLNRQNSQRELLRANLIYRAMVKELPDCLNAKDLAGRFIVANDATAKLMAAENVGELIGRTDADFFPTELAEKFRADEIETLKADDTRRIEQRIEFPDGTWGWLATLKVPLRGANGNIIGLITHNQDITEIRRIAEMKDEFISTVSHELRTPLTSIRGSLGLIASGSFGKLTPEAEKLVRIAHSNSERLVELINDILDIEKIESGKMSLEPEAISVSAQLEEIVTATSGYLPEKEVQVAVFDDAPAARAFVNKAAFHQILTNLVSNAIKFSPQQSEVSIELTRDNGKVCISVVDRGPGVPPEFESKLFTKFGQADGSTKRNVNGTGLGLNIAKSLVERMGGNISYCRRSDATTEFQVVFDEMLDGVSDEPEPESTTSGRRAVFLCRASEQTAAIRDGLLKERIHCDFAGTAEEAIRLLDANEYCALLLQPQMIGVAGDLFSGNAERQRFQSLPVILVGSSHRAEKDIHGVFNIADVIEDPLNASRIGSAIVRARLQVSSDMPCILHVEDDPDIVELMVQSLRGRATVSAVRTLSEARESLASNSYDAVILDIALPDGNGIDLLGEIPKSTSIIVFSASDLDNDLRKSVSIVLTKSRNREDEVADFIFGNVLRSTEAGLTRVAELEEMS